jgi:hypothetical protein
MIMTEKKHTVRLKYDVPEQAELIHILENLNKHVHGSVNQFFIDAAQFYISHFSEEELVNKGAIIHNRKELMTREAYGADRERLKSEIKTELYEDIIKAFGIGAFTSNMGVRITDSTLNKSVQTKVVTNSDMSENNEQPEVLDEVMSDLMSWTEEEDD